LNFLAKNPFNFATENIGIEGRYYLKLKRNCRLGERGQVVHLPKDEVISRFVRGTGTWDKETVDFILRNTKDIHKSSPLAMLDLGSNVGLISLQVLNQNKIKTILVEPVPEFAEFSRLNLVKHIESVQIHNVALSDRSERRYIYIEDNNKGNSTLDEKLISGLHERIEISTIDARDFFNTVFEQDLKIVLKSDMQGSEAKVLSKMSLQQWNQVTSASIEIWATIDVVESDVEICVNNFANFSYVSWHPKKGERLTKDEVRAFWLKGDNSFRNLYLIK
jgi:FkbM family methyltransferase